MNFWNKHFFACLLMIVALFFAPAIQRWDGWEFAKKSVKQTAEKTPVIQSSASRTPKSFSSFKPSSELLGYYQPSRFAD